MENYSRFVITLIKRQRPILFGWVTFVAAGYFLLAGISPVFYEFPILIFLYFFITIILFYYAIQFLLGSRIKKINRILNTDYDPLVYINAYENIIEQLTTMKKPVNVDYYRINLSSGLIAAGRYDEAYHALDKCKLSNSSRIGKIMKAVYYNNLCSVCQKLGRLDEAEYNSDCLAGCMAALSPKDLKKYSKHFDLTRYGVNIANGNFDNAESFYNDVFDQAANNYEKVNAKFNLGKVYLHFGDTARAKEEFEYVVSHGNKLYIVEEAKEFLIQLTK